jgi:steroid delta-isomerase-like uncharacterized protein
MGELERLVHEQFARLDAGDVDAFAEHLDENCEFAAPGFGGPGRDPAIAWMRPFLDAFPDIGHRVLTTVEAGDAVALELEITGTHTAPLAGPGGELSPTGREIRLRVANIWRVRDGRIASYHVYFDQATFMAQLGLVPGAAGAR